MENTNKPEQQNSPGYSLKKLIDVSDGNQEFVDKMVGVFCEQGIITIEEIKKAAKIKDYEKIRKVAHKIKPSLDNLDIHSLRDVIRKLEKIDTDIRTTELPALFDEFCQVLEPIVEELQKR